jgi:serine protease
MESLYPDTDGSGVVIAVVDSGVAVGGDGYQNLVAGYDFFDDDDDPTDTDYDKASSGSHGTHVAGTISQMTDNGTGVAGLAPGASIMPVRVLGYDSAYGDIVGSSVDVADGITWAVDNGAQVINLSLGSSSYSRIIEEACEYAASNNVVVVAASGNDGYTNFIGYPAALDSVLAVGATDLNHEVAYYSNYGSGIGISAPGGDVTVDQDGDGVVDGILQETRTSSGWNYYLFQGTSMATPHVAAAAGLLISNGLTDRDQILTALKETADDLGDEGFDNTYGAGLLNPVAALEWSAPDLGGDEATISMGEIMTRNMGARRMGFRFMTDVPGDTVVTGDNGSEFSTTNLTTNHMGVLRGKPGTEVTYTFTTTSEDGATDSQEITLGF